MTTRGWMALLAAGGWVAIAGCGRGGGGAAGASPLDGPPSTDAAPAATCGNVAPCGGDVAGEWTFGQECESAARVAATKADFATNVEPTWCAIATLLGIEPQASGSLRFDAAGTYSLDLVLGGYLNINYPLSCLVSFDCNDLTAELQSEVAAGTYPLANVTSVSCSGTSSCLCRAEVSSAHTETGTYSTAGSLLVLTATTGAITSKTFCVQGNTLHVLDSTPTSSGQITVNSDAVATKG